MTVLRLFIILLFLFGCQQSQNQGSNINSMAQNKNYTGGQLMSDILDNKISIKDIPVEKWQELYGKKIYFGHQSVGYNIFDGIKGVLAENPQIKLNLVEGKNPLGTAFFAHSPVGINENPKSKTEDFIELLDSGLAENVDIAFHKYCYVDVNNSLTAKQIFTNYKNEMDKLSKKYPEINFFHFTMPLTSVQTGPKAWVKKLLGKPLGGVKANMKRNEYNELLKNTFSEDGNVFDIAAVEALKPDGSLQTFTVDGEKYLSLYPDYTSDGGHLSQEGQKEVAEKFLIFLAEAI